MRRRLIILFVLLCVVGAGLWSVALARKAAKADSISTMVSGTSYGLAVQAANGATALNGGPFGEVSVTCSPFPVNQTKTLLGLNLLHGLITSTTIQDDLTFNHTLDSSSALATSLIGRLTIGQGLLGPLVEVDGLHAIASSTARAGSATSITGTSFFGSLRIAGLRLPLNVKPNTRIPLPGLGSIVLNEQRVENINPVTTYAEVNMVDITLTPGNLLHLAAGTRIIIGHASSLDRIVSLLAAIQAHAFGLYTALEVGNVAKLQLGPVPDTAIGCLDGTSSANAVDLRVTPLVDAGIAQTSATGVINDTSVAVSSSEKIMNLSLLGGLIQAGLLQEDARATYNGTQGTESGHFSAAQLKVAGLTLQPVIHHLNDRIPLPGLGYVVINEVVPSTFSYGFAMNALDIYITTPNNRLSLAVGLHIVVGHVDAGIAVFA